MTGVPLGEKVPSEPGVAVTEPLAESLPLSDASVLSEVFPAILPPVRGLRR
jgi:hypothetical protein